MSSLALGHVVVRASLAVVAASGCGWLTVRGLLALSLGRSASRLGLHTARALFFAALLAPLFPLALPASVARSPLLAWTSATLLRGGAPPAREMTSPSSHALARASVWLRDSESLDAAGTFALVALLGFVVARAVVRLIRARGALDRVLADTIVVRTRGQVVFAVSPTQASPFAAWLHGRAWVVLDVDTFAHRDQRFLALRHELTHHRHGDPRLAGVLALLTDLLGPLGRAWHGLLRTYEELACDDAVVGAGVDVGAYAACLLDIARRSTTTAPSLFTPLTDATRILEKRILSMTADHPLARTRFTTFVVGLAGLSAMALLACSAAEPDLQSHRDAAVATTAQHVATPRGVAHAGSVLVELTGDGATRVDGARVANDDELARRALAAREENAEVLGVVRADASVPHDRVIAVLDRLRDARVQHLTFGLRVD